LALDEPCDLGHFGMKGALTEIAAIKGVAPAMAIAHGQ
jgi:hypothetical protein